LLAERVREIPPSAFKESAEIADLYSGVIHLHAYQPPRQLILEGKEIFNITGQENGQIAWNEKIWRESYEPIIENIAASPHVSFDVYGILRDWIKTNHPEGWTKLQDCVIEQKSATLVLGDSYLHPILPLLPQSDQELLIGIGLEAFYQDFGFYPKGFWLPETAVDENTLATLALLGIDFVLLRDDQMMANKKVLPLNIQTLQGNIQVFVFNKDFSDTVGFGNIYNADYFALNLKQNGLSRIANDWETYGHQRKHGSYLFLEHLVNTSIPTQSLNINLNRGEETSAKIKHRTSWSCDHNLGRWTGICGCDNPSHETGMKKQDLYLGLGEANQIINYKLNKICSNWKDNFKTWFLSQRLNLASGKSVELKGVGKKYKKYFNAKLLSYIGLTSCAWFFGNEGSIERQLAENSLKEINSIFS